MDLKIVFHFFFFFFFLLANPRIFADPQTNLLNKGCSQYNVTNAAVFFANLNISLSDLKNQLSSKKFATAASVSGSDPVYALAQCRDYLSQTDCLSCFSVAEVQIRNCSNPTANGARVIYDGCFIRYENNNFFDQTTLAGNTAICSNKTVSQGVLFTTVTDGVLSDLCTVTPKVPGYFAATKKVDSGGFTVYGVAQCVETASESGCGSCLNVAYGNIQSCPPDKDGRAVDAGCFLRYSDTAFFQDNQTTDLTRFLGSKSSSKKAIIGGVLGGVGLILILFLSVILIRRHKNTTGVKKGDLLGATELQGPVNFHYGDLKSATNNFSEENKLGEGGFGDVFKGILKNGKTVAVKKLTIGQSIRAKADYQSEVKLISNVHHRNLIRLLGCCNKGPELLLVYEYMENNSLDKFIFGYFLNPRFHYQEGFEYSDQIRLGVTKVIERLAPNVTFAIEATREIAQFRGKIVRFGDLTAQTSVGIMNPGDRRGNLSWKQRFDIIIGMARGLAYLHEEFHVCIIHRDIKCSNILLDADLQPKIADFGLARLLPGDQSHLSTRFAGTLGYTAPEYAIHGQLSEKVDTYSYGVVVLEIVSGRKSNDIKLEPISQYLLEWAWRLYEEDMLMKLVDESLDPNEYDTAQVKKVIEVALLCTQSSVSSRPTMSEVVVLLLSKGSGEIAHKPTRPTFIDAGQRVRGDTSSSATSSNTSNATASMTLSAR